MRNFEDVEFIEAIKRKLLSGDRLDEYEIECVCTALRKADGIIQKPYFEVVYHDEYDRKEYRIMNPTLHNEYDRDKYTIVEDRFEVNFSRMEPKGE